jgi:hypothetical protein
MELIEKKIVSKTGEAVSCEDAIHVSENFCAVIDGATSKSDFRALNKTLGQIAAEVVSLAIAKLDKNADIESAAGFISGEIKNFYILNDLLERAENNPANRASACAAVFSRVRREIWLFGDCQAYTDRPHTNNKEIDYVTASVRSLFIQSEIACGKSEDEILAIDSGRLFITPLLIKQSLFQNNLISDKFSYGAFDGFPIPKKFLKVIKVASQINKIALATDGYPQILSTLEDSERELKKAIEADPLCIGKNMGTKCIKKGSESYDDRAYLSIRI